MSNANTEKYISHVDDIDFNKIKSIINNNMEDNEINYLSIFTPAKKKFVVRLINQRRKGVKYVIQK